jgi:hypothetical protein
MATTIVTKNSSTAAAVPTAAQLVQGELAVNVADKRLFTEDNAGAIVELGTNPSAEIVANGGIALPDNGKATFGAGDDLQIYSDGTNAIIKEDTGGSLYIGGADIHLMNPAFTEYYISAAQNGAVTLRHDNAIKLATTSTGIDVTGNLQATGYLAVDGASGNTGAGTDRWIGGDGTAGTWFYNVPTGSNHYFAVNNANKLAINSTGIDVTGTATMDGLTVENNTADVKGTVKNTSTGGTRTATLDIIPQNDGAYGVSIQASGGSGTGTFQFNNKNIMKFDLNNDISFYEDTGTTPKLFWDASAESLGIGTSSPTQKLDISGGHLRLDDAYRIRFGGGTAAIEGSGSSNILSLITNNSERMRIDSSGNLLVGKTADTQVDAGHVIFGTGAAYSSRNGFTWLHNRLSTDGEILLFQKDSTTVGSIGTDGTHTYFVGNDSAAGNGCGLLFGINTATPVNRLGAPYDGTMSLGTADNRFKDLYLSGGVYLGGTGAANKLEDYEEGTFTPTVNNGTISVSSGNYTKVGRAVTISVIVGTFSDTTTSTGLVIQGLPFTADGDASSGIMFQNVSASKADAGCSAYIGNNNTTVLFFGNRVAAGWLQILSSDLTSSGAYFRFSMTYFTD